MAANSILSSPEECDASRRASGCHPERMIAAHRAEDDKELARVRTLTLEERGLMIIAACRLAAEIEQSRLAAGLPAAAPASWPESTWETLRKYASQSSRAVAERR